jgi:hypothetical protein
MGMSNARKSFGNETPKILETDQLQKTASFIVAAAKASYLS